MHPPETSPWSKLRRPAAAAPLLGFYSTSRCSVTELLCLCLQMRDRSPLPLSLTVPLTAMAKGFGSHSGGAVLDKKKVTVRQTQKTSEPKLDQGGGSGGIGKIISFGGDGGDDGGDDDDYFKPGGSGDGDGDIIRPLNELYDPRALAAVLAEWGRTIADIPLFIQQSVQLGAYSSAQLMRFMTMDVRPNVTRSATRMLTPSVSCSKSHGAVLLRACCMPDQLEMQCMQSQLLLARIYLPWRQLTALSCQEASSDFQLSPLGRQSSAIT